MKGETDHDAKNSGHHHAFVCCCRRPSDGLRRSADSRTHPQAHPTADSAAATHAATGMTTGHGQILQAQVVTCRHGDDALPADRPNDRRGAADACQRERLVHR